MQVSGLSGRRDRALGALYGLALGDATGMPTQEFTRGRAETVLGAGPRLLPGPADNPISAGLPAGSVTDDTEQALLLADLLVTGGGTVEPRAFADALLGWERRMAARGSLDLLGPTTRRAVAAIRGGADPATTGRGGSTNGAAMRITPVGIATPPYGDRLITAVTAADRPTHDAPVAHAAALAVALVVSLGVDGACFADAWPRASDAAAGVDPALGDRLRHAVRIALAARSGPTPRPPGPAPGPPEPAADPFGPALDAIAEQVGTTLASAESVPAAFAVAALAPDDAATAGWLGARLGGDSDTIAAIAAAMVGACTGAARLPADLLDVVRSVNGLELGPLADALLALRDAAS